jgi:hypothetical protein
MKRFLPTFFLIMIVLAIYPFVGNDDAQKKAITGLPWQIDKLPDGSIRVFGIELGASTLGDAVHSLGGDAEIAVMTDKDGNSSLEMYFSSYRAGLLSGKLILLGDIDREVLATLKDRAASREVMKSTARKYVVNDSDRTQAYRARVKHIAFIPSVNLDEDIIRKRFGDVAETVQVGDDVKHFLYPALGLDVALSETGKEVLQYVAPADFASFTAPLFAAATGGETAP